MKVTMQTRVKNSVFKELNLPEEYDKRIQRDMFIKTALELQKHLTVEKHQSDEPYDDTLYELQFIMLSMKTFREIITFLGDKLSREDYLELRGLFNEAI
jgi:hypothetical protein